MTAARRWVPIAEAARHFGISPKTLYSLHARGRLPEGSTLRLGRQLRVDVGVIENGTGSRRESRGAS